MTLAFQLVDRIKEIILSVRIQPTEDLNRRKTQKKEKFLLPEMSWDISLLLLGSDWHLEPLGLLVLRLSCLDCHSA